MHLHAGPSAAAEVPGFSQAQLDLLARSVEARRVQLEEDINAYIAQRQDELRRYESELVETLRSVDGEGDADAASTGTISSAASRRSSEDRTVDGGAPDEPKKEKAKKHGRVQKREKELYGLVTPVFLPLLDARESTSPEKKTQPQKDAIADSRPASTMPVPADAPAREKERKRRSSIKKKSALRHSSTPRNRKRVSLVIDDQVVLPSDVVIEAALPTPDSESTSATASTASLDDMIDPRLTSDGPVHIEHRDAVHHSLPLTARPQQHTQTHMPQHAQTYTQQHAQTYTQQYTQTNTHASPAKPPPAPSPAQSHSPPTSPTPILPYVPSSYATRSFLDPAPDHLRIDDVPVAPIPASPTQVPDEPADEGFTTYVGGLSGSGVDDVNQVGSVGYPSSLGASYLESYMQSRLLRVRMAAEGEGDDSGIRKVQETRDEERVESVERVENVENVEVERDGDEDGFMGSMDDF